MNDEPDWAEAAEQRVLDHALAAAPTVGWNAVLVARAAAAAGLSPGEAALLLPGGARDLAALSSQGWDKAALEALAGVHVGDLPVRARIAMGVEAWLAAAFANEAALRRWALFLARPANAPMALGLAWRSADSLWRWAGDVSVDENHYSKRAILAAILTSALAVRLASGPEAASAYLAARIDNVMRFETWKARRKPLRPLHRAAEALGRLRYGGL